MRTLYATFLIMLIVCSGASCQPVRTVNVTVLDDDQQPVEGAEVLVGFYGSQPHHTIMKKGSSDEHGTFSASGSPRLAMMVKVNKEGYYESSKDRLVREKDHDITLILRKRGSQISLVARKVRIKLPGLEKGYGYDLHAGDWVHPHGEGEVSDLIFKASVIEGHAGKLGGRLEVAFTNEGNGVSVVNLLNGYLPDSKMKMPNLAPEGPYESKVVRMEFGYQNLEKPKYTSYFFRTREESEEGGNVTYHYSKLLDGIDFYMGGGRFLKEPARSKHPDEYAAIDFIYYFNPNRGDRNLEFDRKRNQAEILKNWERVNNP